MFLYNGYWAELLEDKLKPVMLHISIAEKALGKKLPKGVEVHHVDEIKGNNANDNLVICPNRNYHQLLHKRTRALNACGHADWLRCHVCKEYSPPAYIKIYGKRQIHVMCNRIP
jgi:hypothetical protein